MKKVYLFLILFLFVKKLSALSVTPNPIILDCGVTSVTFTYDCSFTGSVLMGSNPPGVTYSGPNIKTVTSGIVTFDVDVTPSANSSFSLTFVVISSDMSETCAPISSSASAAFTSICTLPPNDDCSTASILNISTNSCTPVSFSTSNATSSDDDPSCAVAGYLDLFYTFNANNDTIKLEIPAIPGTVGHYGLYDECPISGNEIDCSIMIAALGSTYEFTNLTVGMDYYLQILFLPGNEGIDQELCLQSTTQGSTCPTSVTISDAGPDLPNQSYSASQSIITTGPCSLTASGILFDAATEVILESGFDTGIFDFEVKVDGCTP